MDTLKQDAAKHTPGPWHVGFFDTIAFSPVRYHPLDIVDVHNICASNGGHIAHVRGTATDNANARLIAAAPELLQELRNIANADTAEWDDRSEFEAWAKSRARFAIAKATGGQQ